MALLRPEQLRVTPDEDGDAQVLDLIFSGAISRARITTADGRELVAQLSGSAAGQVQAGSRVSLGVDASSLLVAAE